MTTKLVIEIEKDCDEIDVLNAVEDILVSENIHGWSGDFILCMYIATKIGLFTYKNEWDTDEEYALTAQNTSFLTPHLVLKEVSELVEKRIKEAQLKQKENAN